MAVFGVSEKTLKSESGRVEEALRSSIDARIRTLKKDMIRPIQDRVSLLSGELEGSTKDLVARMVVLEEMIASLAKAITILVEDLQKNPIHQYVDESWQEPLKHVANVSAEVMRLRNEVRELGQEMENIRSKGSGLLETPASTVRESFGSINPMASTSGGCNGLATFGARVRWILTGKIKEPKSPGGKDRMGKENDMEGGDSVFGQGQLNGNE